MNGQMDKQTVGGRSDVVQMWCKKTKHKTEKRCKSLTCNASFVFGFANWYPDPGSNRDGLLHWCLRPARLPIPPSGHRL